MSSSSTGSFFTTPVDDVDVEEICLNHKNQKLILLKFLQVKNKQKNRIPFVVPARNYSCNTTFQVPLFLSSKDAPIYNTNCYGLHIINIFTRLVKFFAVWLTFYTTFLYNFLYNHGPSKWIFLFIFKWHFFHQEKKFKNFANF